MDIQAIPGVVDYYLDRNLYICECDQHQVEQACFYLKSHSQYIWLVDIVVIDKMQESGHFCLKYVFQFFDEAKLLNLQFHIKPDHEVTSIAHLWSNAGALEKEAKELFGIQFNRHYLNDYFAQDSRIYPLRKSEKRSPEVKLAQILDDWEQVELVNSLENKQSHIYFQEADQLVNKCFVQSGNFHIGIEKAMEQMSFLETQLTLENYFPSEASNWSFLLCHLAEEANQIKVPDRAKALRMVILEFNRVLSHLSSFRELCFHLQSNRYIKQSLIWIKRVQALMISACGNEFFKNYIRYGGLRYDISQSWLSRATLDLTSVLEEVNKAYQYIKHNESWKETLDFELTTKNIAENRSLTGPLARAVGLNIDQRKINPFYFYDDVSFDVPVGAYGTLLDLLSIRFEEINQSISIITQVLDNLPAGKYLAEDFIDFESSKKDLTKVDEVNYRQEIKNLFKVNDFNGTFILEGSHGNIVPHIVYLNNKIERIRLYTNEMNLKGIFENNVIGKDREILSLAWIALGVNLKSVER